MFQRNLVLRPALVRTIPVAIGCLCYHGAMSEIVGAHLVGSAPVETPEEMFRLATASLGSRLGRVGDGEIGERDTWIGWQYPRLAQNSVVAVPLLDAFQYQDFDGGTLVVAILLVPLAALFGLSAVTVKAGALLWTLGIVLLWLEVLRHAAGRRAALFGAAAFACAPAPWLLFSSIHWGNHAESAFGPPLILLAGLGARRSAGIGRAISLLVLGGVAGFAVWFSQLNLLPGAIALLGALLVARIKPWQLPLVLLGVCGGLAPRALRVGWQGVFHFGAQKLGPWQLLEPLNNGMVTVPELRSIYATQPSLATWQIDGLGSMNGGPTLEGGLRILVAASLLIAVVAALRWRREGWGLVLTACAVVAGTWLLQPLLLAAASEIFPRRLANLSPLACVAIALGSATLARWRLGAGLALLLLWSLPNLAGTAVLLSHADPPEAPLTPWAWFSPPAREVWERVPGGLPNVDPDLVQAVQDHLTPLYQQPGERAHALSRGFFEAFSEPRTSLDHHRIRCAAPPGLPSPGADSSWAFGLGLRVRCRDREPDPRWCEAVEPVWRSQCLSGLTGGDMPSVEP